MLQGQEILVILLLALVVLGPRRLPEVARKLGNWAAELRQAAREIRAGLEAEVGDVRQVADELKRPLKEVTDTMAETRQMMDESVAPRRWVGPEPARGPTSADALEDLERIEGGDRGGAGDRPAAEGEERPQRADGTGG